MSLLHVGNFLAPFTNRTNLITIILIATLFGMYRFAGGSVRTEPKAPVQRKVVGASPAAQKLDSFINQDTDFSPEGELKSSGMPVYTGKSPEEIARDVARRKAAARANGEDGSEPPSRAPSRATNSLDQEAAGEGGGLDDVAKSLGLQ